MKYRFISADYLRKNIDKYIIIDVRDEKEFNNYHLKGAVNIVFNEFMKMKDYDMYLIREKPIVIYCENGGRSLYAVAKLTTMGYDAYSLSGGIRMYERREYISKSCKS